MIRCRTSYRLDLRLLFCLVGVIVCAFAGCKHPDKTHSVDGFRKLQQSVQTLGERGITVDLDLLKPGARYSLMYRKSIPADEAWQRYGAKMFGLSSGGKVTCKKRHITANDLELLVDLPTLKEFSFIQCTWESEAGKSPEFSNALADAISLSFQETPAPAWVFEASNSTQLNVSLEAAELPPETIAIALRSKKVSKLRLTSRSSAIDAFAELSGSGVTELTVQLPVSETDFQEILRCKSLTRLTLGAEAPVDAEAVAIVAAMDQIQSFACTLADGTDLQQVILECGKFEYCGLSPAGESATHFSLSRGSRAEAPAQWPDDTPAIRAAHAASLPAPVNPKLSVPDSNIWIEPLNQRITFSHLKSENGIRYAALLPDVREIRFNLGSLEVSGGELAEELKKLPHIHTVDLQRQFARRSDVIAALASLPNLRIVKIFGPANEEFAELQKLTSLQRLEVYETGYRPGYNAISLPSVPELAMRHYWLPADTLAEFLKVNKSARVEMLYHNNMPVSSITAAASSDLQQLVLVPIGPLTSDKIEAFRDAWPGHRTTSLQNGKTAHVFSRGG